MAQERSPTTRRKIDGIQPMRVRTLPQIRDLFSRNLSAVDIERALQQLRESNMAQSRRDQPGGKGRPAETWYCVTE